MFEFDLQQTKLTYLNSVSTSGDELLLFLHNVFETRGWELTSDNQIIGAPGGISHVWRAGPLFKLLSLTARLRF